VTEIQSSPNVQQQARTDYVPSGNVLSTAGTADYKGVVIERAGKQTSTEADVSETLQNNATLTKARPFGLGLDEGAVMAKIHQALSELVNVDVTRRKLNRELTFLEADNIASKMTNAAELERKGAVLSLVMSVAGAGVSIAGGLGVNFSRSAKQKELDTTQQQSQKLSEMHETAMKPRRDAMMKDGSGRIDPELWDPATFQIPKPSPKKNSDGSDAKPYTDKNGNTVDPGNYVDVDGNLVKNANGSRVTNEADAKKWAENPSNWKEGTPKYQDGNGGIHSAKAEDKRIANYIREVADGKHPDDLGALKSLDKAYLQKRLGVGEGGSDGLLRKLDNDLKIRNVASSGDLISSTPQAKSAPSKLDQDRLNRHELDISGGYADKSTNDELKKLSSADAMLTAWASVVTLPGQVLGNVGNAAADLSFNKEAKELEAQATRDSASQSFFSDNASTLSGEIQGALQGIDAVKGYIEVGGAVASGIRA
jgi:hypothetical protein